MPGSSNAFRKNWTGESSRKPGAGIGSLKSSGSIESDPIDFTSNHNTHFHIDLRAPDIKPLDPPQNLLAESANPGQPETGATEELRAAAQALLAEVKPRLSFDQGDLTMLIMDMPDVPPQFTPIIVAQKSQAAQQNIERTIGVCKPIENKLESRLSAINSVSPLGEASSYLENIEHRKIDWSLVKGNIKMTLLQAPTHGELRLYDQTQSGRYFSADYNYEGPDRATVLVEIGTYKVKVVYHFVLMQSVPGSGDEGEATDDKTICPNGYIWKISFNPDDPNAPVYTVQHPIQLISENQWGQSRLILSKSTGAV